MNVLYFQQIGDIYHYNTIPYEKESSNVYTRDEDVPIIS